METIIAIIATLGIITLYLQHKQIKKLERGLNNLHNLLNHHINHRPPSFMSVISAGLAGMMPPPPGFETKEPDTNTDEWATSIARDIKKYPGVAHTRIKEKPAKQVKDLLEYFTTKELYTEASFVKKVLDEKNPPASKI